MQLLNVTIRFCVAVQLPHPLEEAKDWMACMYSVVFSVPE